jgi:hypothetical protein
MSTNTSTPAPWEAETPANAYMVRTFGTTPVASLEWSQREANDPTPTSGDAITVTLVRGLIPRPCVSIWGVRAAGAVHA